jgi:hypothetical protein
LAVGFLGHMDSRVAVGPQKVAAFAEWSQPASCTDFRRFVGLANYYRKFVLNFSGIAAAAPLTALCSGVQTQRLVFVGSCRAAELRRPPHGAHISAGDPRMGHVPSDAPADLHVGAGGIGHLGAAGRRQDAGAFHRIHPVAFESRRLTQLERSYPPHVLELFVVVVHALKTLCPYLLDKPYELHTDNASLQWLQQQRHVSHHQACRLNVLSEYQHRVVHIQGRTNPADFLTRKRLQDGQGPVERTGYAKPDSEFELFTAAITAPATAFVHVSQRRLSGQTPR